MFADSINKVHDHLFLFASNTLTNELGLLNQMTFLSLQDNEMSGALSSLLGHLSALTSLLKIR